MAGNFKYTKPPKTFAGTSKINFSAVPKEIYAHARPGPTGIQCVQETYLKQSDAPTGFSLRVLRKRQTNCSFCVCQSSKKKATNRILCN